MNKELLTESNKHKIKKLLIDFIISSTIHGLPNIFKSKTLFLKIMWTFFILVSLSYCSFSIIKSINSYYSWEYVTNIDVIQEVPTEFPAITICNLNIYESEFAQQLLKQIFSNLGNISNDSYYHSVTTKYSFQFISMGDNFNDENRRNLSLPLKDFLIDCNFGLSKCSAEEFDWYYSMQYGNCYTFNSGHNIKGQKQLVRNSSQAGSFNGLRLELFLGKQSDVPNLVSNSGAHVFVNNKSFTPKINEGIDISNGELSNIIISRTFINKLAKPFSDCQSNLNDPDAFDSEIYRAIIKSNKTYCQKICFDLCLQKRWIETCGCYIPFINKLNSSNKCDSVNEVQCGLSLTESFFKKNIYKICSPYCPLECNDITYSLSVSHSDFPNPNYAEILKKKPIIQSKFQKSKVFTNESLIVDNNELKKSIAAITIYYDDLKYTLISQIPKMSFEDLLANIGGQLGLFIGISFLSFVEIFDALIQVIFLVCNSNNKNKVYPVVSKI